MDKTKLNLPSYEFVFRDSEKGKEIFDATRKRYVKLTPEEWVRQHFIEYLISEYGIPRSLIGVEISCKLYGMQKRMDLIISNRRGQYMMLVECKEPGIPIRQDVFDQAGRYNIVMKVPFLVVTNGMDHYACRINHVEEKIDFLERLPGFEELNIDY